jgi:hypothetical protein
LINDTVAVKHKGKIPWKNPNFMIPGAKQTTRRRRRRRTTRRRTTRRRRRKRTCWHQQQEGEDETLDKSSKKNINDAWRPFSPTRN